jgi:hypothetical protein
MNEIDQILLNIDKVDDDKLFSETDRDKKKNDEITKLIDSLDGDIDEQSTPAAPHPKTAAKQETAKDSTATVPPPVPETEHHEADDAAAQGVPEIFAIRGTKSWNRREPYLIRFNQDLLKNDMENLQKSFFFVDEPSDASSIKIKIKQEIVAYLRKPSAHVTERYQEFIYRTIITAEQELSRTFSLVKNNDKLFMYHIGPLTFYKYIKDKFNNNRYGYCYKYLPGNKASRFFPDEFIKEIVLKWFEQNINTLDLPFDSIQKYEEIKAIVLDKYHNDLRVFNARLEQLNSKLGSDKTISRVKLFQIKGAPWFGQLTIEVYRRFMGTAIFM